MKKLIGFLFVSIFIVSVYSKEEKRIFLKNNYYSNGELGLSCLTDKSIFKLVDALSYYSDFDSIRYQNKTIGYIVNDLKENYKLLETKIYSSREKCNEENFYKRTNFSFIFKKDDTTALQLRGCLDDKNIFIERNDSVAIEKTLMLDGFLMEALLINYRKKYLHLIESSKTNNSDDLKSAISYCKKYFPEACK
jgi:hypothetical protein